MLAHVGLGWQPLASVDSGWCAVAWFLAPRTDGSADVTTEPLLKPWEVAKLLGISVTSLNRAWREGTGPEFVWLGAQTKRCTHAAVQAYIEQLKGSSNEQDNSGSA